MTVPADLSPLWLSLETALLSTAVTAILGSAVARMFLKLRTKVRLFWEIFFLSPLVLPPTVVGYGLMVLLGRSGPLRFFDSDGFLFTTFSSVVAAIVVSFPLMYLSARSAFRSMDRHLLDAATSLGARGVKSFFTIELPLALQGLMAGVLLTFGRSLGEFGATLMVSGNIPGRTQTLPLAIYFDVEGGDDSRALFWTIVALMTSGVLIWGCNYLGERKS